MGPDTNENHYLYQYCFRNQAIEGITMKQPLFQPLVSRLLAATLGTVVASTVFTAALPAYLPFSQGDSIAGPILLFPFIWVALFLFTLVTNNIGKVWGGLGALTASHLLIIYLVLQPISG